MESTVTFIISIKTLHSLNYRFPQWEVWIFAHFSVSVQIQIRPWKEGRKENCYYVEAKAVRRQLAQIKNYCKRHRRQRSQICSPAPLPAFHFKTWKVAFMCNCAAAYEISLQVIHVETQSAACTNAWPWKIGGAHASVASFLCKESKRRSHDACSLIPVTPQCA